MNSNEIRKKFLDFFKKRYHAILNSDPVVIRNSQSVTGLTLFNTAGVQPLIPYLLGTKHPQGKRLASSQKCIRTIDINDVGDDSHLTFFEMLGNWSLGDYFKKEAIGWSYEFLTSKEEGLGLDSERLYVTVFEGDEITPKDEEAYSVWKKLVPENRIYFMGKDSNWWEAGENGPCGPDTEMFYDVVGNLGDLDQDNFIKAVRSQKVIEVWNDVFMQFEKKNNQIVGKLPQHAVDTGAGLERLTTVVNNCSNVYETDIFKNIITFIKDNSKIIEEKTIRIIADHLRASTFIITEDIVPSNSEQGYVLRRLLRKVIILADKIGFEKITDLVDFVSEKYESIYPELKNRSQIKKIISEEELKFRKTLKNGLKEFEKQKTKKMTGEGAFVLFSTHGFPIELTLDLAKEKGLEVDLVGFKEKLEKHKEKSRTAAVGKFKGGLQNLGPQEIKYHTANHLLHQALRQVLGNHIEQKGSNINSERLRFDFSHSQKITDEEKKQITEIVNQKIKENLPVNMIELEYKDALKTGALHFFADKYGDRVKIYYIGNNLETAFSKEFCNGPHVEKTGVLGHFEITKEEASSAGVRRIKAVLK